MALHPAQRAALDRVRGQARARRDEARETIADILKMSDQEGALARTLDRVRRHAHVGLHFHPDRLDAAGVTVARSLLERGRYHNQFESGISNGSVSATPGGARDRWEQALFGGAYSFETCAPRHRPRYGALALLRHADGPAPRFGSCYLLLKPGLLTRCTFSHLDTAMRRPERGTIDEFEDVLAALLSDVFFHGIGLGARDLTVRRLLESIDQLSAPLDPPRAALGRNLNHYVEAQVHGEVHLADDVAALVADPSFRGHPTGDTLQAMARRYGFPLWWHPGFALRPDAVPTDVRGPAMPSLARRVADTDGLVHAHAIGAAAVSVVRAPTRWEDRGTPAEVLQELKLLWHVLVRCGAAPT